MGLVLVGTRYIAAEAITRLEMPGTQVQVIDARGSTSSFPVGVSLADAVALVNRSFGPLPFPHPGANPNPVNPRG